MARQIDILRHARDYLKQLNCGTDPLSGLKLPDSSVAREEGLRKTFFFSSRNLDHIIVYDDVNQLPPFFITPEQQSRLHPKKGPVNTRALLDLINKSAGLEQCRGLVGLNFYDWLEAEGYLCPDNTGKRCPTALGRSSGITLEAQGFYSFNSNAQQVIIDRLQDLSRFNQAHSNDKDQRRKTTVKNRESLKANLQAMEQLSQGRHPGRGTPLPSGDPLNQERLRKCFAYVAWAQRRSLEAGYFTAKGSFTLPQELWKNITISQEPIRLSTFVKSVSELLPDPTAVRSLTSQVVKSYLLSKGLMQMGLGTTGRETEVPSSAGNAAGFEKMEAIADSGKKYFTISCDAAAQQYLVDHLAELISFAAGQ